MILITGHSGFLGMALVRAIQERYRAEKAGGVLTDPNKWTFFGYDLPRYTILREDPWNDKAQYTIERWARECNVCFHIAAVADLNESAKDPGRNWRVNIEGTLNVAEACAKAGCLLVYISTCCAYGAAGEDGQPLTEAGRLYPTEQYAWSKLLGEHVFEHVPNLRYRIARIGTLYGPGMRPALFNRVALERISKGQLLTVHGSGDQTRTYLYIDDCAAGLLAIWEQGVDGEAYNVAGTEETSVMDTINAAAAITGKAPMLVQGPDREGQIRREVVATDKLRALGWAPQVKFAEGMAKTWEWMKGVKP